MYHSPLSDARFLPFLNSVDENLAETARKQDCPCCGGPLHSADYPRKPRGGPDSLPETYQRRFSFCCAREGCRKRTTPPSARFLGRKVYLAVVVILVAAMRHGPTPSRVRALSAHFGADRRTIARWQVFWRELFPNTPFWKAEGARLVPGADTTTLPLALLDAFLPGSDDYGGWERLLRFLAPITIPTGLRIKVS
jgi:hypothetical protein